MRRFLCALGLIAAFPAAASDPFPGKIGGPFSLTTQHGDTRTQVDPDGHTQLLFFGYANCPDICTAALPLMAMITDALSKDGHAVRPLMITVDPTVDTPANMTKPMADLHPEFLGLTGTKAQLGPAYEAFQVDITPLFTAPDGQTIYAHGSFIYLLDADGNLLTLIPPILGPGEATKIVQKYLPAS